MKKIALMVAAVGFMSWVASAVPSRLDDVAPFDPLNSQDAAVKGWVQALVHQHNSPGSPAMPDVGALTLRVHKNDADPDGSGPLPGFGARTLSIELPVGSYNYIALLWGTGRGLWESYFTGSEAGSFTFSSTLSRSGLSEYVLFGPVINTPDAGSTMALLGLGVLGLGALRRKLT